MIAQLSGILLSKSPQHVVIDVGGVGYHLMVSLTSFSQLPDVGTQITMHTHTHLREDMLALFGFTTGEEKAMFQRLIAVSGVGPKTALTILSGMPAPDLVSTITSANSARLQSIPGVGKKTAERIIVELKDKLLREAPLTQGPPTQGSPTQAAQSSPNRIYNDVLSALMNLGYQRSMAEKAMSGVNWADMKTIENAIRATLKEIAAP